jgi:hypothetical protein
MSSLSVWTDLGVGGLLEVLEGLLRPNLPPTATDQTYPLLRRIQWLVKFVLSLPRLLWMLWPCER